MDKFPELERALLMWLWDFCVEIQSKSSVNKMTVQVKKKLRSFLSTFNLQKKGFFCSFFFVENLGIVIGPNLFNTEAFQNPMKAMEFSGKVVTYFQKGVEWRMSLGEN